MEDLDSYFSNIDDDNKTAFAQNFCKIHRPPSSKGLTLPRNLKCDNANLQFTTKTSSTGKIKNEDKYMRSSFSCSCISETMPNRLPPEVEVGNVEYKRNLINPTSNRLEHLITQLKWRLNEGGGEAIYRLGVDDDGRVVGLRAAELSSSLHTLKRMAQRLNATIHPLRERLIHQSNLDVDHCHEICSSGVSSGECRKAIELLVRIPPSTNFGKPDVCIAVLGGVDAGKSTLIGVLTDGELDNARGRARLNLFRHLHEVQSGRTSCLSSELLGFNDVGVVTNYARTDTGRVSRSSVDEVVRISSRLITLMDLAGHWKYQRTTLSGLSRSHPVAALLVVSATTGLTTVALEHAQLAFGLGLPLAVVINKIDLLHGSEAERQLQITTLCAQVADQFKQFQLPITPMSSLLSNPFFECHLKDTVGIWSKTTYHEPLFFPVSAVTGAGIDELVSFLSLLSQTSRQITSTRRLSAAKSAPDFLLDSPVNSGQNLKSTLTSNRMGTSAHFLRSVPKSIENTNASESATDAMFRERTAQFIKAVDSLVEETAKLTTSPFVCYWINQVYTRVLGVPYPILIGTVQSGQLVNNQLAWLGPDQTGEFHLVRVMGLKHNRQNNSTVYAGQTVSIAVQLINQTNTPSTHKHLSYPLTSSSSADCVFFSDENDENIAAKTTRVNKSMNIRRGMVLLTHRSCATGFEGLSDLEYRMPFEMESTKEIDEPLVFSRGVVWEFQLQISYCLRLFPAPYSPSVGVPRLPLRAQKTTVYTGCVVQTTVVTNSHLASSASDDNGPSLTLRFTRHPEYLEVGRKVILSWAGCAKAVGRVVALVDVIKPINPESPTVLTDQNQTEAPWSMETEMHTFSLPPNTTTISSSDSTPLNKDAFSDPHSNRLNQKTNFSQSNQNHFFDTLPQGALNEFDMEQSTSESLVTVQSQHVAPNPSPQNTAKTRSKRRDRGKHKHRR